MKYKTKQELNQEVATLKAAIKQDCYECMGGGKKLDCEISDCSLYPYRPFPQNKKSKTKIGIN